MRFDSSTGDQILPVRIAAIAAVSKTAGLKAHGGSSPSPVAKSVEVPERPKGPVCKTVKPSVRIRPSTPYPCGQIGKGSSLKRSVICFPVRVRAGVPMIKEAWQSLAECTGLENRRSERVREFESHRFHHTCLFSSVG